MKLFGLTGGIGMGKSTAVGLLRERGVPVVDTDDLARELVEPGCPALAEITHLFGPEVINESGCLRRDVLARIVFNDADARKQLEEILHPRIRQAWRQKVEEWRAAGQSRAVVVIPLLFETQAEKHFDVVVCFACTLATQNQRLLARGWDAGQIARRVESQWPISKKMDLADRVIWTEGSLAVHSEQLLRVIP